MVNSIQPSRRYERVIDRVNRIHDSHNRLIVRAIKKLIRNVNIKIIIDSGDQGIGKTTHWIRRSINYTWITIVFTNTHSKAVEILKDLELSPETFKKKIKPKLKYSIMGNTLRVHTLYSKTWTLDENDWYVSSQFEGKDCLCYLKRENPRIFEMLKQGHLNRYCRAYKSEKDKSLRCIHRRECLYNRQLGHILEQIKGSKWQLLEKKIREQGSKAININVSKVQNKYPKLISIYKKETGKHAIWRGKLTKGFILWINKKIKENTKNKIEIEKAERKKIHHIIILPHIYIFLETINILLSTFKDEIDAIIDENLMNLMFEPIKITYKKVRDELLFIRDYSEELENEGVSLKIYEQFKPIIRLLYNNLNYNREELRRIEVLKNNILTLRNNRPAQLFERQRLESYRNELDDLRLELLLKKLIEFSDIFDEIKYQEDYTNYINGIIEANSRRRVNFLEIPNNLFIDISNILAEIKRINNTDILEARIEVDLRNKFVEIEIDRRYSLYDLIEEVKNFIIFTDATAEKNIFENILGHNFNTIFLGSGENISHYISWGYPKNKKVNAKYHLWNPERHGFLNDGYDLIDYTAWLIKENKSKKLMIALYGEFNNWKKREERYDGLFMTILGGMLRIQYNIEIRDLDIILGFWYSEGGKDIYKDREVQIQFGCPGIPSKATRNKMRNFNLSRNQVNRDSIDKEQKQMAGRTRSFKHYNPVKLYLLTSRISSYFGDINNISIALKHKAELDYIREHGEMTTRQIQHDLYPDRELENVIETLNKIEKAKIGLCSRYTRAKLKIWYFKN